MNQSADSFPFGLPPRATTWKLRTRPLPLGARPLVMGIVNVTPDSFSDGGQFFSTTAAVEQGLRLVAEGADLIDIGGESTRPYAEPVSLDEELRRVLPVVAALAEQTRIPLSIDTYKAAVALRAIEAGAEIINDVTGLTTDPDMLATARDTAAGVCVMHIQGTPRTMQDQPTYSDVVAEVGEFLRQRRDAPLAAGIDPARICLDPGIGFGKTHEHNRTLMAHCWRFHALGCPLLVGHSRKGFIAKILGDQAADRTAGSIGAACALALQGVQIIRVHDVTAVRQALELFVACRPG